MKDLLLFNFVPLGITPGGIALACLEFCTVILFAIGGLLYYKLTRLNNTKKAQVLALCGALSCFVGGLPNAIDKLSWAVANLDLWFNSVWMFFFVGIGYMLLFFSALEYLPKKSKEQSTKISVSVIPILMLLLVVPAFHKPMKYLAMLCSCVGMLGFYIIMYITAKKYIGRKALLYFVTMGMTLVLVVFGAAAKFNALWPNMLAQTLNNLGYTAFILANYFFLKKATTRLPQAEC